MVHHREIKSFIVAQGSWSLRGPVNLLYDVTELQGIKIPQFSQFCLFFQRLKVPFFVRGLHCRILSCGSGRFEGVPFAVLLVEFSRDVWWERWGPPNLPKFRLWPMPVIYTMLLHARCFRSEPKTALNASFCTRMCLLGM